MLCHKLSQYNHSCNIRCENQKLKAALLADSKNLSKIFSITDNLTGLLIS
jgi:hypothetical protein